MRKAACLLALCWCTLPMWAAKGISVADLGRRLASLRGKPDVDVAQQLAGLELTERLSAAALARWDVGSLGPSAAQELRVLADQSAFLPLPVGELPLLAPPDLAEQRRVMALVVQYVGKTIHQLPNFYATRVTTRFEETPQIEEGTYTIAYRPLHEVQAVKATVLYRDGQELVEADRSAAGPAKPQSKGLNAWGVFGPILSVVFLDAAKSALSWSHWEQSGAEKRAVFRYAVPLQNSHYRATYCCIASDSESHREKSFDRVVGYRGEIAVDPRSGSIVRLTVQADLKPGDPIQRADMMVEYAPVEIGGQKYLCATRSVALSSALSVRPFRGDLGYVGQAAPGPPQKLLNDVAFEQYHVFRADAHILTAEEAGRGGADSSASTRSPDAEASIQAASPVQAVGKVVEEDQPADGAAAERETSPEAAAELASPPMPGGSSAAAATVPIGASGEAEKNEAAAEHSPVLHVTTREVIVDVVATRADGRPVPGLGKQEFEVREDSKLQTVDYFEEHTPGGAGPSASAGVVVPSRVAPTGGAPGASGTAVNVLLLDTLNTEVQDQATVRREVLGFLGKLPPGTRMAIFLLGSKLRCVQGLTSDSTALLAALNDPRNGFRSQKSSLFASRSDRASDASNIATLETMQTSPFAIEALKDALQDAGAHNDRARVAMTYAAFMYLGQALSEVPGRKNLIWVSGSFPVVIPSSAEELARLGSSPGHLEDLTRVLKAADLLTASQISVYPISAEGLTVEHVGEAETAGLDTGAGVGHGGGMAGSTTSATSSEAAARVNTVSAMERIAASTGGRAFYNTNDLAGALRHALDEGAGYYTLGYSPSDKNMDGSYREIAVKPVHGKEKLIYRRGYIAPDASTVGLEPKAGR